MVRGGPWKAGWAAILAPRGALEKPVRMVLTSLQEKDRVSEGQWLCGSGGVAGWSRSGGHTAFPFRGGGLALMVPREMREDELLPD